MTIDMQEQRRTLEAQLADVKKELADLGIHNPDVPEDWIATPSEEMDAEADENVAADRIEDWTERRATLAVLETRYNNIVRALANVADGTYGTCGVCGEAIEEERLRVHPAARTCMAHKDDEATLS